MERTELFPYQRIQNKGESGGYKKDTSLFRDVFSFRNMALDFMAFMLGRAVMFSGLTPFGLPFYAATFTGKLNSVFIGISAILGFLTAGIGVISFKYVMAMVIFTAIQLAISEHQSKKRFLIAANSFISLFIPGFVVIISQGFLLYDLLMLLFESFISFVMVYIFSVGIPVLKENVERTVLSTEEIISLSILLGLVIMGFADSSLPGGISIRNTLCILILLIFSLEHGIGVSASTGIMMGVINSMSFPAVANVIGNYAFCGLLSGVFRSFGKIGVSLGFILANAVLTIYINGSTEVLINISDILVAVLIFSVTPNKVLNSIGEFLNNSPRKLIDRKIYSQKLKEITADKLTNISKSFEQLANTFDRIAEKKTVINHQDVSTLFDQVAERVCKNCGLCLHCWEREFHNTYQIMFKILEKLEEKGNIDVQDVPEYFSRRCIRIEEFVRNMNNLFEVYKVNLVWESKVNESRGLISQQLQGISKIIQKLANEIDLQFDEAMEKELIVELDRNGIKAKDVTVLENSAGKYEVEITLNVSYLQRRYMTKINYILSKLLERKMIQQDEPCRYDRNSSSCIVKYIEAEVYKVSTGIARAKKDGQTECGDNYSLMQLKDGKYALALSDGMGSGRKASRESSATIALLEQFLDSGFDKDTAVNLINSVLVLKSPEESFATIDLCLIDMYTGNVEFVKIGAAATFIKKQDKIEVVRSTSLPIGILNQIDMELSNKTVSDGDYIIMVSDGVLDSDTNCLRKEDWIKDALNKMDTINPQRIADQLLEMAKQNSGNQVKDDMTVMVTKVWKKVR